MSPAYVDTSCLVCIAFDEPGAKHLATALYLSESPGELPFFTLDERQRRGAQGLGFPTPA